MALLLLALLVAAAHETAKVAASAGEATSDAASHRACGVADSATVGALLWYVSVLWWL